MCVTFDRVYPKLIRIFNNMHIYIYIYETSDEYHNIKNVKYWNINNIILTTVFFKLLNIYNGRH